MWRLIPLAGRTTPDALGAVVVAGALWITGQSRGPQGEEGPAAELRRAPPSTRSLKNPFTGQPDAIAAGKKLFERHCAQCHGTNARGQDNAPDLHSQEIRNAPPGSLFWVLRNGRIRKGMPSWSRLPDQQIWQLVTYLQTLH